MLQEENELSTDPEESKTIYKADWSIFARRLTVIVLFLGIVVAANLIRPVLEYVILAVLLVFILSYPVRAMEERTRLSYSASAAITYLLYLFVGVALFLFLAIPALETLGRWTTQVGREMPSVIEYLENYTPGQGWLVDPETGKQLINFDFVLEPLSEFVRGEEQKEVEQLLATLAQFLTGSVVTVIDFVTGAIIVHIMALFFLLELPALYKGIMGRIPINHQPEYRTLTTRMLKVWVGFFRGTVASAGIIGLLTLLQLLVMGIPGALPIGLLLFVTSLIPMVGGIISMPVLVLNTFLQGSTFLYLEPITLTTLVLVIHIIISQFIWNVFYPKQTGKMLKLPVSLILVGLAIGAALGGVLGILLAVPILGTVRELVEFLLKKVHGGNPYPSEPVAQIDI